MKTRMVYSIITITILSLSQAVLAGDQNLDIPEKVDNYFFGQKSVTGMAQVTLRTITVDLGR